MIAQGHLAADLVFVDTLDRLADSDSHFTRASTLPPPGWHRSESEGWIRIARTGVRLPDQGWKIHISATANSADRAISTTWDYCTGQGLSFKFLRSLAILRHINSKQAPRTASGKLITVYPADDPALERALTDLSALLHDIEGPYILSDLRWGDGPLYVRYGGFRPAYCFDADGEHVLAVRRDDGLLVPDHRGPGFRPPAWAPAPPVLANLVHDRGGRRTVTFPFRIEKALHFSNGGGVYRAVERDTGRRVILKEARPHAGIDNHDRDAVTRLAHEHRILDRLAHLACVPRVHSRVRHWEHHYLVQEFIDGKSLLEAVGRRHPLLGDTAAAGDRADLATYTRWATGILARIEAALADLHRSGIVFGDLQPSNVIVRPDDTVCLIDFETSVDADNPTAPVLGTPGFIAPWARTGAAVDTYALASLGLALFCPLTPLLPLDDRKPEQLIRWAEQCFPLPAGTGDRLRAALTPPTISSKTQDTDNWPLDPSTDSTAALDSLRDAILRSATPDRDDRLFPGDVRQFDRQGASLAFGAAGVLHALHVTGRSDYPAFGQHVDWLVAADQAARSLRPGLFDGLAGIACVLDELQRPDAAEATLDRLTGFDLRGCGIGLFGGLAGIALAHLHFHQTERAAEIGERLTRALTADTGPGADRVGLMHGWSGPALLFTRLYSVTGDLAHLDRAHAALARDLAHCEELPGGRVRVRDGQRRLATLGRGSAGIGITIHEYLRHRDDHPYAQLRDHIRDSLDSELLLSAGLLDGHAGLLYSLTHLSGSPEAMATQLRGLVLHAVRHQGDRAFAGDGQLRLSMDLATGTAGVLLAAHTALNGVPQGDRDSTLPYPLLPGPAPLRSRALS
ncbi:class III lanthionine synthetase LanKC [Kitasatospora sp. NPDC057904]|uniref:class III lanthionine synthetase LanKC n=1 Tax=unclassified Kitasatospora TaxID=2633591 RepID=UPI0036D94947